MKIFLSWSGERSKHVALALRDWIKMVLQATEPWISAHDVEGGTTWLATITQSLKDSQMAIICLTPENLEAPWLLFEAGAIGKGHEANRVCTLLIGVKHSDITGPLSQFHHTTCDKDGLKKLLISFNKALEAAGLEDAQFNKLFELLWPQLEPSIKQAFEMTKTLAPQRSAADMLSELLEIVRSMEKRVAANHYELIRMKADTPQENLLTHPYPLVLTDAQLQEWLKLRVASMAVSKPQTDAISVKTKPTA